MIFIKEGRLHTLEGVLEVPADFDGEVLLLGQNNQLEDVNLLPSYCYIAYIIKNNYGYLCLMIDDRNNSGKILFKASLAVDRVIYYPSYISVRNWQANKYLVQISYDDSYVNLTLESETTDGPYKMIYNYSRQINLAGDNMKHFAIPITPDAPFINSITLEHMDSNVAKVVCRKFGGCLSMKILCSNYQKTYMIVDNNRTLNIGICGSLMPPIRIENVDDHSEIINSKLLVKRNNRLIKIDLNKLTQEDVGSSDGIKFVSMIR